jgi:hypothetical protein
VLSTRRHIGRRLHEEILALLAGAVDAELVLGIEGGPGRGEAADRILHAVERAAAELQQAAQFAARERVFRQRVTLSPVA